VQGLTSHQRHYRSFIYPRRQCCHKNTATWKVVEFTASDEGIPAEGMVQKQPWPTRPKKLRFMVRLTVIRVAVIPNPPEPLTTSPFVQDLIYSQNDQVMHP